MALVHLSCRPSGKPFGKRVLAGLGAGLGAVLLASCGGGENGAAKTSGSESAADETAAGEAVAASPTDAGADQAAPADYGFVEYDHLMVNVKDADASAAYLFKLGFLAGARPYVPNGPWYGGGAAMTSPEGKGTFLEIISDVDPACEPDSMEFLKAGFGPASMVVLVEDDMAYHDAMVANGYKMHPPFAAGDRMSYLSEECREKIGGESLASFTKRFSPIIPVFGQAPFNFNAYAQEAPGVWQFPPQMTAHPNTAQMISQTFAVTNNLADDAENMASFWQLEADVKSDGTAVLETTSTDLIVLTPAAFEKRFPGLSAPGGDRLAGDKPRPIVGVQILVGDMGRLKGVLTSSQVEFTENENGVFVAPESTTNTLIEFTAG